MVKLNEILDKINSFGINSINDFEIRYLHACSLDDKFEIRKLEKEIISRTFISSDNLFSFEFVSYKRKRRSKLYYGVITVPSLKNKNGVVNGRIKGYICKLRSDQIVPFFEKDDYDILDFCYNIEYELDAFLEYVIKTIEEEKI